MTVLLSSSSLAGNGNDTMTSGGLVDEKAPEPCTSPPPVELTSCEKEKQQSGYYFFIDFHNFDIFEPNSTTSKCGTFPSPSGRRLRIMT
jgi:hypothetical protein